MLAVDVYNLETVQAALEAAAERQAPIILALKAIFGMQLQAKSQD